MKSIRPSSKLWLALITLILAVTGFLISPALPQTRERTVTPNRSDANIKVAETIKTDIDLVTIDALVLQKNTARVVGGLKQEDFLLSEDGSRQMITHFSQDTLPLSVLLLIDRGGCLDPFGEEVRRAANDALSQLKPSDEVAVMTYHNTAELRQGFTHDRILLERAASWTRHPSLAELTVDVLRELAGREGIDFATALLYDRVLRAAEHGPFAARDRRGPAGERTAFTGGDVG